MLKLTMSELADYVTVLGASAREVQERIHIAAWNSLDHIREHGNYTGALQLLNALPNGQRVKGLALWYKTFSSEKFVPRQNGKTKVWECEKLGVRTDADFRMVEAEATTFADLTAEKNPETITLEKFLHGLKRTATNEAFHDGTAIPKVAPEVRMAALVMLKAYNDTLAAKVAA